MTQTEGNAYLLFICITKTHINNIVGNAHCFRLFGFFFNFCSLLYVETADRPGLLVDLVENIKDINLAVESGEFDTEVNTAYSSCGRFIYFLKIFLNILKAFILNIRGFWPRQSSMSATRAKQSSGLYSR